MTDHTMDRGFPGDIHPGVARLRDRLMQMGGHGEAHGRHGGFGGGGPGGPPPFGRGPWGFGGPGGRFGRGGFGKRMKRGDVRAAALSLLAEEPRNGYQIIQEIEKRSQGLWRPSAGSVYPALQLLQDEGLVAVTESGGKREFKLTTEGETYVKENAEEVAALFAAVADSVDGATMSLFELGAQVGGAVFQVTQAGTPAQVEEARKLLMQTRKGLYTILAGTGEDSEEA